MSSFDLVTHLQSLLYLEFYALCPNGKRIRVQDFCKEAEGSKEGYLYRTFDDRLVLVIEAVFPAEAIYNGTLSVMVNSVPERTYWRQAFYLSTGESSHMENTWLPFSGIFILFQQYKPLRREIIERNKKGRALKYWQQSMQNTEAKGPQVGGPWFAKSEYIAPEYGLSTTAEYELSHSGGLTRSEQGKVNMLEELYGKLYLPEGNFLRSSYSGSFSRFGCPSYALASHAIGGTFFHRERDYWDFGRRSLAPGGGDRLFASFNYLLQQVPGYNSIRKRLNTSSAPQACFSDMKETYPIEKPYKINNYIEAMKAIPIMNAFRDLGVFPPGHSLIQMPVYYLGYSLPVVEYYGMLQEAVYYYWIEYKIGRLSKEDIQNMMENPSSFIQDMKKKYRWTSVLGNEKTIWFNVRKPSDKQKKFYGGKTRRKYGNRKGTRKAH